jgi:cobalt-zinc-cadmium efflux system membrane fusion protein
MTNSRVRAAALGALVVVALVAYAAWHRREAPKPDVAMAPVADARNAAGTAVDSVSLSDAQLASVKVEPAAEREFPVERDAVGSIDFDEDMSVEIFTPY